MPFDGVEWDSPIDGAAIAAHPGATLTSEALVAALVSGYYAGRRVGRLFGCQTFERLERSAADGDGAWFSSLTPLTVGGARGWIDGTWTHAVAYVVAEVVVSVDVLAQLRVVATDGTTTATGTTVERAVAANADADLRTGAIVSRGVNYDESLVAMSAEVSLATLTLSARCRVTAEGHAASLLSGGYYRPRFVALFLECRG